MKSSQIPGIVSLAIPWMLSTAAIILRLLARRITKTRLWWDDWMALSTYVWAVANSAFGIKWVCDGLALHRAEISWMTPSQSLKAARMNLFFLVVFYALAVGFAKIAVLALYWRMFSLGRLRYPIIVLTICSVLWTVIRTVLSFIRCIPIQKYWDPSVDGRCPINDAKLFPAGAFSHLTLDVLIIALPLFELRKLRMSVRRKLGVIVLFMFGIVTCLGTTFVILGSLRLDETSEELSYTIPSMFVWANVEVNFGVISACAPLLRPLFSMHKMGSRDKMDDFKSTHKRFSVKHIPARIELYLLQDLVQHGDMPRELKVDK
ncbi:hypothetical protein FJTKL_15111 [Diaporthe vaccinii]|uniref:Rhodopsin domain-containing protein n=1 Tax=Diaporthe vaccinii TaxID=105482 RepID=A0ABR4E5V1_9PEZI